MKKITCLLLCFLILLPSFSFATESNNQELKVATYKDFGTPTPFLIDENGSDLLYMIYDTLFIIDEDAKLSKLMAKDFSINEKYNEYTIKITDNLMWHDGSKVTLDDIKFSYEYLYKHGLYNVPLDCVDTITIEDDVLTFNLKYSNPNFMKNALCIIPIIPKHIYENIENPKDITNVIGSSAFKLTNYNNKNYTLEKVSNYFVGEQNVDKISVDILNTKQECLDGVARGDYQTLYGEFEASSMDKIQDDYVKMVSASGYIAKTLYFNTDIVDINVRKAISKAIDYDRIINEIYYSKAKKGLPGYFNSLVDFSNKDLEYNRDLNSANNLLQDEIKNSNTFKLTLSTNGQDDIGQIIKENLNEIGIEVEFVQNDGDLQIYSIPYMYMLDEYNILNILNKDGYLNKLSYQSETFNNIKQEYIGTIDAEKRYELLLKTQQALHDEMPFITIVYPDNITIYNSEKYDTYIYKEGSSIFNKLSFLPNRKSLSKGLNQNLLKQDVTLLNKYLIAVILIIIVVVGLLLLKYKEVICKKMSKR